MSEVPDVPEVPEWVTGLQQLSLELQTHGYPPPPPPIWKVNFIKSLTTLGNAVPNNLPTGPASTDCNRLVRQLRMWDPTRYIIVFGDEARLDELEPIILPQPFGAEGFQQYHSCAREFSFETPLARVLPTTALITAVSTALLMYQHLQNYNSVQLGKDSTRLAAIAQDKASREEMFTRFPDLRRNAPTIDEGTIASIASNNWTHVPILSIDDVQYCKVETGIHGTQALHHGVKTGIHGMQGLQTQILPKTGDYIGLVTSDNIGNPKRATEWFANAFRQCVKRCSKPILRNGRMECDGDACPDVATRSGLGIAKLLGAMDSLVYNMLVINRVGADQQIGFNHGNFRIDSILIDESGNSILGSFDESSIYTNHTRIFNAVPYVARPDGLWQHISGGWNKLMEAIEYPSLGLVNRFHKTFGDLFASNEQCTVHSAAFYECTNVTTKQSYYWLPTPNTHISWVAGVLLSTVVSPLIDYVKTIPSSAIGGLFSTIFGGTVFVEAAAAADDNIGSLLVENIIESTPIPEATTTYIYTTQLMVQNNMFGPVQFTYDIYTLFVSLFTDDTFYTMILQYTSKQSNGTFLLNKHSPFTQKTQQTIVNRILTVWRMLWVDISDYYLATARVLKLAKNRQPCDTITKTTKVLDGLKLKSNLDPIFEIYGVDLEWVSEPRVPLPCPFP